MNFFENILKQEWAFGVFLGFLLARTGSWLDTRGQIKRERQRLFNSFLDELNAHDFQIELLLRSPDELRPLDSAIWQQVKTSGELWTMNQETLNHITTYGELIGRYNHHFQKIDWLKREILDHPSQGIIDSISRVNKQLVEMLMKMREIKRNTAFEVRWWMKQQGLLSDQKWKRWINEKDKLATTPANHSANRH